MMLPFYRVVTAAGGPLIRLYLTFRLATGKEDRARFGERLGQAGRPRPQGPVVWVHAASVGESLSMLPLVERLRDDRPDVSVLVTTGTVTSARLMADRLPDGAFHQYVPVDRLAYVCRFLDHWQPDLALWAESEFWPNLISETVGQGVPMILINGRVSPRAFAGWQRYRRLIRRLLAGFTLCLGQTEADTERLSTLGAQRTKYLGNLKFAAPALPADEDDLARLRATIDGRPRWLAASTHAGEEEIAGRVHRRLAAKHPGLLTVIVPRHPQRGRQIVEDLRAAGLEVALRSSAGPVTDATEVYVADTMGELGLFYRLAGIVFMGKSLVPHGGQNPLEAARLDCALIYGPHMTNFADIVGRLRDAGASEEVADEAALAAAVDRLLADGGDRTRRAAAAQEVAAAEAGVLDAVMNELAPFLNQLGKVRRRARA